MTLNLPLPSTQRDRIPKLFQGTPLKIFDVLVISAQTGSEILKVLSTGNTFLDLASVV